MFCLFWLRFGTNSYSRKELRKCNGKNVLFLHNRWWITINFFSRMEEGTQISITNPGFQKGSWNLGRCVSQCLGVAPFWPWLLHILFPKNACVWKVLHGDEKFKQKRLIKTLVFHAQCITYSVLGCERLAKKLFKLLKLRAECELQLQTTGQLFFT